MTTMHDADLIKRLREVSAGMAKAWEGSGYSAPTSLLDEAADELERLRSRLADIESQNRVMWDVASDREARLAEAEALLREWVACATNIGSGEAVAKVEQAFIAQCRTFLAADSASAVQSERCCLDYPRCDCNSPPEPDNAPTLQPCGHPWKAQHDFKCILCSSPGDATSAQLAEEQRFSHSAPAGCNHFPGQVNCEWCTEPERATQPVEPKP